MTERPADEVWDTLTELFGEVRTKSERGRRNRAVGELREAKATPEEIRVAYAFCKKNFTAYTEMALCNWLSRSLHEYAARGENRDSFLRLVKGKQ